MKYLFLFIFQVCSIISVLAQNDLSNFTKNADVFFRNYVKEGKVDYEKIKKNPGQLKSLIDQIANEDLSLATKSEKKAFYINAYNIIVIQSVIQQMPLNKNWYKSGFFDKTKTKVAGESITLDVLQKERLFSIDKDETIHFALVCAAKGCPPLKNGSYQADKLDRQLDNQCVKSMENPRFIRIDPKNKSISVSEIFNWYDVDFTRNGRTVLDFINIYRTNKIPQNYKVNYYEYDWSLNSL